MIDIKQTLEEDSRNIYHRVALKLGKGLPADAIQKMIEDEQDEQEVFRIREQQPEDYKEATSDLTGSSSEPFIFDRRRAAEHWLSRR